MAAETDAETRPGTRPGTGERRAWGWVAHLLDGGATPWRDWSAPAEPTGLFLPGAQQLELLRRMNAETGGGVRPGLGRRVLEASAPGRGRPDLQLVGAADASDFGPRPVDPGDLPDDELLRVATGLLADDLNTDSPVLRSRGTRRLEGSVPSHVVSRSAETDESVWARPWRTRYRLVGDPWLAEQWRAHLRRRGRPPGGIAPRIVIVGGRLDMLLAHTYADRAFDAGVPRWPDWVAAFAARGTFAPRVDLPQVARTWARRAGAEQVRLVLDPALAAGQVGVRRLPRVEPPGASAVELARLVAGVLGLLTTPARRARLLRDVLAPRMAGLASDSPLAVPVEHHGWLTDRAERMRARIEAADYAVEGRPADLAPAFGQGTTAPDDAAVLTLAMRMLTTRPEER